MHGSTFPARNSSIIDHYFALKRQRTKQNKKELQFPNSKSETLKLSRRSAHKYELIEQNNRKKKEKKIKNTGTNSLYSNKTNNNEKEIKHLNYCDDNDMKNTPVEIKYSWQDLENWIPPSEKKRIYEIDKLNANIRENEFECKIKYSWQVIGMSSQTSGTFINGRNDISDDCNYKCDIKYSWQIIGTGTQASLHDNGSNCLQDDYWNGKVLTSNKFKCIPNNMGISGGCNRNKNRILYSEITQTSADKSFQTDLTDCRSPIRTRDVLEILLKMDSGNNNTNTSIVEEGEPFEELNNTLTDETLPLTDNLNESCATASYYIARYEHKDELIARSALAQEKIKSYEDSIDKISSSIAQLKLDKDISINRQYTHGPINIQTDINSVMLYIHEHIKKLEEQFKELDNADYQIANTTERVLKEIDCTYERLASQVIREINQRRDLMRLEAEVFQKESLAPLKACRKEIKTQIFNKNQSILHIEKLLKDSSERGVVNSDIEEILNANRNIGGIPAVPSTDELPYLTFKPPTNLSLNDFFDKIHDLGSVLRLGPAEIIGIEEKPASVFVKWDITNPEFAGEEQIYVLQKADGEIFDTAADVFATVYEGPETCTFVRDILVNQPITLRIGIQSLPSAWSAPRIVKTHISNYHWCKDNQDYIIKDRIAAKVADNISTLFSHGPQIDSNQIIEFKFLEVSKSGNNDEGIALVVDPKDKDDNLRRNGVLMITSCGKIFMDGDEKLMRLPQIKLGTRIIFTILRKKDKYLRINIESDDKAVTYDWPVQTPLYFAARFSGHGKWHLMVK